MFITLIHTHTHLHARTYVQYSWTETVRNLFILLVFFLSFYAILRFSRRHSDECMRSHWSVEHMWWKILCDDIDVDGATGWEINMILYLWMWYNIHSSTVKNFTFCSMFIISPSPKRKKKKKSDFNLFHYCDVNVFACVLNFDVFDWRPMDGTAKIIL